MTNENNNRKLKNGQVYPMNNIRIEKRFYSVCELKKQYDDGKKVVLDSEFQRAVVWSGNQKAAVIESVLMGLPIPTFYFNEDKLGRLIVIDGRQRLTALFEFLDDGFELRRLNVMPELNGKRFSDLSSVQKAKIEDYQIIANVIQPPTPDRVMFDIFERINRTGTMLNQQEMRNALYQGNATLLLKKLAESEEFELATGKALKSNTRMKGKYLLNRFLAFYLYFNGKLQDIEGNVYKYRGDIDELLGLTLDYINELSQEEIDKLERITKEALEKSYYYLGKDAFRREEEKRTPINMGLFEAIVYAMTFVPDINSELKKTIEKYIQQMLKNDNFLKSIGSHRDGVKKVTERFKIAGEIRKVLNT